jgi:methyl-accepting chemotaxis protein WspA
VKKSSIELMSTATQFAATSKQQESTVNGFGASTSEIAAAVREISATSQELLTTIEGVNKVAGETAASAESGRDALTTMGTTMQGLAKSTTSISSKLSVIREKAADINVVVTTITKVADQTNLLSVNAAIEAEKAGEYGLGFIVLAREIRRLADQTAVATLDIEQMVRQMQAAVSAGVMEMDKFTEEVRRGVEGAESIGGQMEEIITQVTSVTGSFESVAEAMRAQSQGARQINDAMVQLTEGARQTAGSLKEFNNATDHLRDAVSDLKQEISHFTVTS